MGNKNELMVLRSSVSFISALAALILFNLPLQADTLPFQTDSLTIDTAYDLTFENPELALEIIQHLRDGKEASEWELDLAQGDILFNNQYCQEAYPYYKKALAAKEVKENPDEEMALLHRLISCLDRMNKEKEKLAVIQELLDKSRDYGCTHMESIALFNLGKSLYWQGDTKKGYDMMTQATRIMEGSDYNLKYDNLRYEYNTLIIFLIKDQYYERALEVINALEAVVTRSSGEETEISGLDQKELKTLYANKAVVLAKLGRMAEADAEYRKWKHTAPDYTNDDYLIGIYLIKKGLYDEALEIYKVREAFLRTTNDTISYQNRGLKRTMADLYESKGEYRLASQYYLQFSEITDSLKTREQKSAAVEIAAIHENTEQERILVEQRNAIKFRNVLLISAFAAVVMVLILLYSQIRYARIQRRKNRILAESIKHLREMREAEAAAQKAPAPKEQSSQEDRDRQAFEALDKMVRESALYLDPDLDRSAIINKTGLNKNRVAQLVQQFEGKNLTGYVNSLRIEHAMKLIEQNPHFTNEAVAMDSGFNSSRTFYRIFKETVGMSPTEYKQALNNK